MRMTERIKFIEPTVTADQSGGFDKSHDTVVYECWADVSQDGSGREFQNMQIRNATVVNIKIRYNPGFEVKMKYSIVWQGKKLIIHTVPDKTEKGFISFRAYYNPDLDYEIQDTS